MTTLEELNQREIEEIQLVRDKYAKLRGMVPHVCEPTTGAVKHHKFGFVLLVGKYCKHCGAAMSAK